MFQFALNILATEQQLCDQQGKRKENIKVVGNKKEEEKAVEEEEKKEVVVKEKEEEEEEEEEEKDMMEEEEASCQDLMAFELKKILFSISFAGADKDISEPTNILNDIGSTQHTLLQPALVGKICNHDGVRLVWIS